MCDETELALVVVIAAAVPFLIFIIALPEV